VPEVILNPSNHSVSTGACTVHFLVILPSQSRSSGRSISMRFAAEMCSSSFVNIYGTFKSQCQCCESNFDHESCDVLFTLSSEPAPPPTPPSIFTYLYLLSLSSFQLLDARLEPHALILAIAVHCRKTAAILESVAIF
jgi:hypothetical protein